MKFYSNFRIKNAELSYLGTINVAIYALYSGEFLELKKYACGKDLTNIISAYQVLQEIYFHVSSITINLLHSSGHGTCPMESCSTFG